MTARTKTPGFAEVFPAPVHVLSRLWLVNVPVCRLSPGWALSGQLDRGAVGPEPLSKGVLKTPHLAPFARIMALF